MQTAKSEPLAVGGASFWEQSIDAAVAERVEPVLSTQLATVTVDPTESAATDDPQEVIPVLRTSLYRVLPDDAKLNVVISSFLSSEFSQAGDLVEARILVGRRENNEVLTLLRGSKLSGAVNEVIPARRAGRAGRVKVRFSRLILPDGSEHAIDAELASEDFRGQEALRLVVDDLKLVGRGALWGSFNSLRYAPFAAWATEGISLAVGAGVGMTFGMVGSLRRDGDSREYFPGEGEQLSLSTALSLSGEAIAAAKQSQQQQNIVEELIGFDLSLKDVRWIEESDYEGLLAVALTIQNDSGRTIFPNELLLIQKNGAGAVLPDIRYCQEQLLGSIRSGERAELELYYPALSGRNPREYFLALVDPLERKYLAKLELANSGRRTAVGQG